jgi:photosystem II stability/assembly factor-like uncharacterized protein
MRHIITILTLLLACSAFGADYQKIDLPTTADINKILFYNDQMGWAATSAGEVLSTFDGGKTWRKIQATSRSIHDIDFMNRNGYIVGERGLIMKSTNGGATWQDMSLNIKYDVIGVGILDDTTIITCVNDLNSMSKARGDVFESRDGGKTWKKHAWRLGNGYTDLAVCPPRKVYLLASKKAFHSISWGVRYFHGAYGGSKLGFGFDFIDDYGYMVGHKGLFDYSMDHGRNWKTINIDTTAELYAVEMFDRSSGVAVGEGGLVMYFYDDGDRQSIENCGWDTDLHTVCVTGDKIFFGGDKGLMFSKERFPRAKP